MKYNCYVCGYHIYCEIWEALVDKVLTCRQKPGNTTDMHIGSCFLGQYWQWRCTSWISEEPAYGSSLFTYISVADPEFWKGGVQFQFRAAMPKVVHRGVYIVPIRPREARKKKKSPSFFTSGWALVAHSCFALLSSTWYCIKLWWRWQLKNCKINTKSHEVSSSASLAS